MKNNRRILVTSCEVHNRHILMEKMAERNRDAAAAGGIIIASGIADYRPETDVRFLSVFERADAAMYENKKMLKQVP